MDRGGGENYSISSIWFWKYKSGIDNKISERRYYIYRWAFEPKVLIYKIILRENKDGIMPTLHIGKTEIEQVLKKSRQNRV